MAALFCMKKLYLLLSTLLITCQVHFNTCQLELYQLC